MLFRIERYENSNKLDAGHAIGLILLAILIYKEY